MWRYQKPGFEALLLTELQKQQQQSQFCDTVLQAEGVSVPAHSCILSAISPHISSALSSKPVPPVGQSHLLEFQALRACTLLHMARLIYSGEMAGEGENEKQEAISAASKLGIHGLVEVKNRKSKGVGEFDHYTEVGVQTEPLMIEENEERCWRWKREVRDESTLFWKNVLSNGGKDIWTQTEELHLTTEPPAHQAASYETIDVGAFQSLGQPDSHQFVPIAFVYPPDENQMIQLPSAASACVNKSTAAEGTSFRVVSPPCKSVPFSHPNFSSQANSSVPDSQSCWAGPQVAGRDVEAAGEWEDECFEQFQGNIPGFISHFLSPDSTKATHRGRARRRQRAGVGGARRAGTGEQSERKSQARSRRRGGCTEKVDLQEIGVSKMHKLFLHKWGMRTLRTGQGGGAVGRKLYLKTRDLLKPTRGYQRRGRGKMWEFSQSENVLLCSEGRGKNTRRGQKDGVKQRGRPAGRTQTSRNKLPPVSLSAPHEQFHNVHTLTASSHSLQTSPPHSLLSPAASYLSPVSSLLQTTPARPLAMLSHEDQPEQIDRLLEEVMMGLDILPNNNHKSEHSQQYSGNSSSNTLGQNKQQNQMNGTEVPFLQQQCEGELTEMLENFLQTFEHHVHGCSAREETETDDASSSEARVPHIDPSTHNRAKIWKRASHTPHRLDEHMACRVSSCQTSDVESDQTGQSQSQSQPHKASTHCDASSEHRRKGRRRRRQCQYLFSLQKKRVKVKKPESNTVHAQTEMQLQQIPVVKLERRGFTQQGQSLGHKSSSEAKTSLSAGESSHDKTPGKNKEVFLSTKTYPIRSRFKQATTVDSLPSLGQFCPVTNPPSQNPPTRRRRGRPRNSQHPGQSVDSCGTVSQPEKHHERDEDDMIVQSQEEAETPSGRGEKRRVECYKDTSDDAIVRKKICLEHMKQKNCETFTPNSEPADRRHRRQEAEEKKKAAWTTIKLRDTEKSLIDEGMECSEDDRTDVEREQEDCETLENRGVEVDHFQSWTASTLSPKSDGQLSVAPSRPVKELSLERTEKWDGHEDEDIDVVGVSSPAPEPVIISWSSEVEEDEEDGEVDVVGEKTDCSSPLIFTAVSNINTTCKTEVLSR